jgi:hypothetical protein
MVVTCNGFAICADYDVMQHGEEGRETHTGTNYNNIPT